MTEIIIFDHPFCPSRFHVRIFGFLFDFVACATLGMVSVEIGLLGYPNAHSNGKWLLIDIRPLQTNTMQSFSWRCKNSWNWAMIAVVCWRFHLVLRRWSPQTKRKRKWKHSGEHMAFPVWRSRPTNMDLNCLTNSLELSHCLTRHCFTHSHVYYWCFTANLKMWTAHFSVKIFFQVSPSDLSYMSGDASIFFCRQNTWGVETITQCLEENLNCMNGRRKVS